MATRTVHSCDRCKAEIEAGDRIESSLYDPQTSVGHDHLTKKYDLCPKCGFAVKTFIESGPPPVPVPAGTSAGPNIADATTTHE